LFSGYRDSPGSALVLFICFVSFLPFTTSTAGLKSFLGAVVNFFCSSGFSYLLTTSTAGFDELLGGKRNFFWRRSFAYKRKKQFFLSALPKNGLKTAVLVVEAMSFRSHWQST